MKIQRRIKRTTKQYIIVAFLCIIVIGGAALFTSATITGQIKEEYQGLLVKAQQDLKSNQKYAFIATVDIAKGDLISSDNVKEQLVFTSQPETSLITKEEFGRTALINIPNGTQLLSTMLTVNNNTSQLREMEYNVVSISSNIIDNDVIDVRIFFPNGEDYIVLSKKSIKGIADDANSCLLWLEEEEILRMASAVVDAYLYNGAKIYTTKYIEPNIQDASFITYEPSISTLLLIQENPNIVDQAMNELSKHVRKAMENRLAASMNIDVKDIDWELNPNDISETTEASLLLKPEEKVTFLDEIEDREAELDYGP